MSASFLSLAVMVALLFIPDGKTQFTISSTEKAFAVKLHDGYWRVTSSKDPQGTDYKLQDGQFVMRNRLGRLFPSKIEQDIDWSGVDFTPSSAVASFRHPSLGSPLKITRSVPGLSSDPKNDRFLTVIQESGWVKGFFVTFSKTEETIEDGKAEPSRPANPTPPGTSAAEQPRVPGSGGG
jgi:hypothetical protein